MPRRPRIVIPGLPYHVTQRGVRRTDVFFEDEDREYYLRQLVKFSRISKVDVIAYCLMTNHVHLIVTPDPSSNLSRAIAETHRRYTRMINFRENWRGYLWQGRFASFPMDKSYLLKAAAYVELNPVKANLVSLPEEYRRSSIHAHLKGEDPFGIVNPRKLLDICGDWEVYLQQTKADSDADFIRCSRTGRPLGDDGFIEKAEQLLNRNLKKKKPGPKVELDN